MKPIITAEIIERKIYLIRGQKVMLDRDLAVLYAVETFNLNKAVKRNIDRFPVGFYVPDHERRGGMFDIPIWNIKDRWSWWPQIPALCLY